jgi:hypothetical protein
VSLVLEALRRVEKSAVRPGSVGAAVASYRPAPRPRGAALPLFLGLGTGAVLLLFWKPQARTVAPPPAATSGEASPSEVTPLTSPPVSVVTAEPPVNQAPISPSAPSAESGSVSGGQPGPGPSTPRSRAGALAASAGSSELSGPVPRPTLLLQAISERDSRPVAVINDQLVREGELFEGARILRIGADSVDVLLESGKKATVRFGPPPADVLPTPESR